MFAIPSLRAPLGVRTGGRSGLPAFYSHHPYS
nr:MAG TPA: hypothetical protein [Caudoviricetes sp.]